MCRRIPAQLFVDEQKRIHINTKEMIYCNLRMVIRRSVMFCLGLVLSMSSIQAQSVNYNCDCDDMLNDEYIRFEITVNGTGPFTLCNATSLYLSVEPFIPVPNNYVMTETAPGSNMYTLNGFAYNNILPFVQVKGPSNSVIDVNMLTCMKPVATIATTQTTGDFCIGQNINLEATVLTGNILPSTISTITWSAPGGTLSSASGSATTSVTYSNAGQYIVQVSGETSAGCEFTDDLLIDIINGSDGVQISGPLYTCGDNAMTGLMYTASNPNGIDLVWSTSPNNVSYAPNTGDPLVGMGNSVTATFPNAPGTYTLQVTNADPNVCAVNVTQEVELAAVIDTLEILGTSFACVGETIEYCIHPDSKELGSTVIWTISPTTGATVSTSTLNTDCTDVDFLVANMDYVLTATGTTRDGCPFIATKDIQVANTQTGSIACNNLVNISLNNDCVLELVPDMILEGDQNNDAFTLEIFDATTGEVLTDNMITQDQLGHTFMVTVTQRCGTNSCWGNLVVEDKSITPLDCTDEIQYATCYNIDDTDNPVGFPNFDADVVITYREATNDWLLEGFDNCSDAILSYTDENESLNVCDDPQEITRTWHVTDINNGAISTCEVDIHVNIVDQNSIQWPPHYDTGLDTENGDANQVDTDNTYGSLDPCDFSGSSAVSTDGHPHLSCGVRWTADDNGNPHPDCTGNPTGLLCTNLQLIGYVDQEIPICGNSRKILRRWTVWDACSNDEIMHTQIITLMDTRVPQCNAPEEYQAYTEVHECGATVYIQSPRVFNECEDWTYTIKYKLRDDNGFIPANFTQEGVQYDSAQDLYYVQDVPFDSDTMWVNYVVRDACGNETDSCFTEIELIDNEQPIPACDLNTIVTLNAEGCAYASPGSFDDNSWDNCGVYQTVVRRMDNRCDCNYGTFDYLYPLGEFGGHSYFLSKDRVHAQKAFDLARAIDGYAVVMNSAQENSWVNEKVRQITNELYIIGLRGESSTTLTWTEGTSSYSNWDTAEPSWDVLRNAQTGATIQGDLRVFVNEDGTWDAERRNFKEAFYVVEIENTCQWTQQIKFCCADVGQETMVVMRVFDWHGNHNECMVNVDVKDHIGPVITCPADVTIDCTEDPSSVTSTATATDLCGVDAPIETTSADTYECGDNEVIITRTWTATDVGGNTVSCDQRIYKRNRNPFTYNDINWPGDHEFTNMPCSLEDLDPLDLPSGKQEPGGLEHSCSELAASYDDLLFIDVEGYCQKLVRTWTVVDWCQPDSLWTYNQVIKMTNNVNPSINPSSCTTMTVNVDSIVGPCQAYVGELTASLSPVTNNCANEPIWTYDIYFQGSSAPDRSGNGFIAANTYPYGSHRIVWTVTDDCNNTATCNKTLVVKDTKRPTPYCLNDVVVPFGQDTCVTIWASDLDLGSADDCPERDVRLSFSESSIITNRTFCCEDLDPFNNRGNVQVQLWVWDLDNNKDYCTVNVQIQDNRNECDNIGTGARASIAGVITTEELNMVSEVEMTVMNGQSPLEDMAMEGEYAFNDLEVLGNYVVNPDKDDAYLNGVSTLDLVLIQKHILGVEYLDTPYKVIAADVDNSQSITAIDLIELRKLILGIYDELPDNDSWRFVDKEHQFQSDILPFPYPEVIYVNNLTTDVMDADFIAVKIGDVNSSVVANLHKVAVDRRSGNAFQIEVKSVATEKGNTRLQFVATTDAKLIGFQTDIEVQFEEKDLMAFIPMTLSVLPENIAWNRLADKRLVMSWHEGASLSAGDVLFELLISGDHKGQLRATDQHLMTEVYLDNGQGIDVLNMDLIGNTVATDFEFMVSQNVPNPFKDVAMVEFTLPEAAEVVLSITDQNGRLIYKDIKDYNAGNNNIVLKADQINANGVLYYQISTEKYTATKKMIIIK